MLPDDARRLLDVTDTDDERRARRLAEVRRRLGADGYAGVRDERATDDARWLLTEVERLEALVVKLDRLLDVTTAWGQRAHAALRRARGEWE